MSDTTEPRIPNSAHLDLDLKWSTSFSRTILSVHENIASLNSAPDAPDCGTHNIMCLGGNEKVS
jgi:hypothetical protein